MDEDTIIYAVIWVQRVLAIFCLVAYGLLYLTLSCGQRLQRKTHWLQCQLAICIILRSLCSLIEGVYTEKLIVLSNEAYGDENADTDTHLEPRWKRVKLEFATLVRMRQIFAEVSDFAVLSWNTFTLLTLYQFYYDLKRPLTLESFTLRNAVFTFGIWLSAFSFCAVFVAVRVIRTPGYVLFVYLESISISLLSALHILAMCLLIGLIWRLQRNGFVFDLLPFDFKESKVQYVLDKSWSRARMHNFIVVYVCASMLIVVNLLVEVEILYPLILGLPSSTEAEYGLIRRAERCAWFLVASAWPLLWIVGEGGLRKQSIDLVQKIRKKTSAKEKVLVENTRDKEEEKRKDETVVYVISE